MAAFTVNGRPVTVENNQKLIRFLRDGHGARSFYGGLYREWQTCDR